jgi:Cft2 family RNA processing exonuclease
MLDWQDDLKLRQSELYLDSRRPRPFCFVSHAHADHLGPHSHALGTAQTLALARRRRRADFARVTELSYREEFSLDARTILQLLPAGHVLGSSMLFVQRPDDRFIYTGDFKLRPCLTVPPAQLCQADVLVMESTYGLPLFRFPPREQVVSQLLELVETSFRAGRQPILLGYSLGKAQEIIRILADAGHRATAHGAVHNVSTMYETLGVPLGNFRRYAFEDFHGPTALDLRERGVLVAPPQCARSAFVTPFENPCRIILTGWAMLKNAKYRYGVDHALPLSDHADFDELLELVERVHPRKIFTHHGYREFADTLRRIGFDATCARKDPQMTLFGD